MRITRCTAPCLLVACALASATATVRQDPEVRGLGDGPDVATLGEPPSGLIALKGVVMPGPLDQRTVNHPLVSGIAKQFEWRDLEPVRGKPDWTQLDSIFGAAEGAKKWVRLVIYPGMSSPPWALEGAKVERFARQYGPVCSAKNRAEAKSCH